MTEPLVTLEGVGKSFPRITRPRDRIRALGRILRGREPDAVEILRDIDLEVLRGQSVGIMGENGAGKSTLLKIIAGVLAPTTGTVNVRGGIGALLELQAGFHQDYTGRENLRLASALMGLSRRELNERMEGIIEFADIGDYLDEPIRHFSSGMIMRLGFALIASIRPDLLITDEVLAVGDESFQKRCIQWMEGYLAGGGTLLLVSHSTYHVQKLCQRACWIHHGRMHMHGDVHDVSQAYLAYHERKLARQEERPVDPAAGEYRVVDVRIAGATEPEPRIPQGGELTLEGSLHSPDGRPPAIGVGLVRADGTPIYGTFSELDGFRPERREDGSFGFRVRFPALSLLPGSYQARVHAMDPEAMRLFDTRVCDFSIGGESREMGYVRLDHEWERP